MNKARQKIVTAARAKIEEAKADIEALRDDMQNEYDDKSERWQEGEAGQAASEELDTINAIADSIENTESEFGNLSFE
jgi:ribosome recycling factor